MGKINKARQVRKTNIAKAKVELAAIVKKVDKERISAGKTLTQTCRDYDISTERYYRFKRAGEK